MQQLTFLLEEPPAKVFPLQDYAAGCKTPEAISCLPFLKSLSVTGLNGLSGKTSPVFCQAMEDGILVPSSGRWGTWGTGGLTECWTLNGSEWPNDAVVCSLSDVLVTELVPERFFLSAKACQGILRRADKRGKELPEALRLALQQVAGPQT